MTLWLTVVLAGVLTYAQRLSFIALWQLLEIPPLLQRSLRFVPVAVLVALIVPDLLPTPGMSGVGPRLPAGLLAALVAWRTGNVLLTLVVGIAVLLLLQ